MRDALRRIVPRRERTRAFLFLAVWVVALLLMYSALAAMMPPRINAAPIRATLLVDGGAWSLHYAATTENNTAFDLLREASLAVGFELDWVEYGWPYEDVFVTSINGTRNGAEDHWWQYCVNDLYADRGAVHQEVRDGDVVRWVYAPPGGDALCL